MKRLFVIGLLVVAMAGTLAVLTAPPAQAARRTCANVRCAACPPGYHLLLQWPNCCACVPN